MKEWVQLFGLKVVGLWANIRKKTKTSPNSVEIYIYIQREREKKNRINKKAL